MVKVVLPGSSSQDENIVTVPALSGRTTVSEIRKSVNIADRRYSFMIRKADGSMIALSDGDYVQSSSIIYVYPLHIVG